ncbi:MAG TPA: hypothetical protein VFT74_09295 [Isosphaeraceae bacterium]|nr:hypothetical protein [Isosphaeraceae bacterium]
MTDRDRWTWTRLLADPLLHLLLIVVGLSCLAVWRASSPALGYDPISDAHVIHTRQSFPSPPIHVNQFRTHHAG